VLLDGLDPAFLAIVATSNRLEAIDPALRRRGFDYHIEVPVPTSKDDCHLAGVPAKMKTRGSCESKTWPRRRQGIRSGTSGSLPRSGLQAIRRDRTRPGAQHLLVSRQISTSAFGAAAKRFSPSPQRESPSLLLPGIASTSPAPRGN